MWMEYRSEEQAKQLNKVAMWCDGARNDSIKWLGEATNHTRHVTFAFAIYKRRSGSSKDKALGVPRACVGGHVLHAISVAADEPDNLPFRQSHLFPTRGLRDCSRATAPGPSSFRRDPYGASRSASDFGGDKNLGEAFDIASLEHLSPAFAGGGTRAPTNGHKLGAALFASLVSCVCACG